MKTLTTILVLTTTALAVSDMDYPVNIPTSQDTLHVGVALVSEGRGFAYGDYDANVYHEGSQQTLTVTSKWDTRQGIKAELSSNEVILRAAYFDDQLKTSVQRMKNGTNREDFLRKEDLAKFLWLSVGTKSYDVYFQRDFSRFGTYQIGDNEAQPFTMSDTRIGIRAYDKTKLGAFGAFLEGTRTRSLKILRIGQVDENGNVEILQTLEPVNKTVNGVLAGFYKSPNPSGKLYITSAGSVSLGVTESPIDGITDIGLPGYHMYQEGYDLVAEFSGSAIMGLNMQFGMLKVRLSAELFGKSILTTPASNVYPDGVSPENLPKGKTIEDYNGQFSEEYALMDIVYGASAQLKVIF
jgi:hypothetical protein